MLLLAGSQILGRYIDNAVGIDIKGNFNLRYPSHCRRDPVQTELAERLIILGKLSLSLQNVDVHCRLIVCRRREDLALLGRNRRVPLNQSGCDSAHGFNRQRQRRYIQKQDVSRTGISG